jgi:hypothetical protein
LYLASEHKASLREWSGASAAPFRISSVDILRDREGDDTWSAMVIDCGGGTVDITVLQSRPDDKFAQVYSCGNDGGATQIDLGFQRLIQSVFTRDLFERIRVR